MKVEDLIPHVMGIIGTLFPAAHLPSVMQLAMDSFGPRLITTLTKEYPTQNIILSPFSLETGLTMVRMGADGETALEMDKTLYFSDQKPKDLAIAFHNILKEYKKSSSVQIANKIFVQKGYELQKKFNKLLAKQFHSKVDFLNFTDNEAAANSINSWLANNTNDFIKDLIDPNSLDAGTHMILVNTIHVMGIWMKQFDEKDTKKSIFYVSEAETIEVEMMKFTKYVKYANLPDLNARAIELPYKNSTLAMLVILPVERAGLNHLEAKLKHTRLSNIIETLKLRRMTVAIPKFRAEFQAELSASLSKMGMKRMFSDKQANFNNMFQSFKGGRISVVHKAVIEVNERGTEAAAAGTDVAPKFRLPNSPSFIAQHPFYYAIIDENTGMILLSGHFKNKT